MKRAAVRLFFYLVMAAFLTPALPAMLPRAAATPRTLPVQMASRLTNTSPAIEFVNSLGGSIIASFASGIFLYVGEGNTLVVLELKIVTISNPAVLQIVGSYPARALIVQVVGTLAYITDTYPEGVKVLEISNPGSPILRGSYATFSVVDPTSMSIVGDQAYLSGYTHVGLQIVDAANPLAPVLRGASENVYGYVHAAGSHIYGTTGPISTIAPLTRSTPAPGNIALVGSLAYVASGDTLEIIDVGDPARPTVRTAYDTPGHANDVQVVGTLAYVADTETGLTILDISDPLSPTVRGRYLPAARQAAASTSHVRVKDQLAYLGTDGGIRIVDVGDPARPFPRAANENISGQLQLIDDRLYVAGGEGGFQILRVHPDRFPPPMFMPLARH